MEKQGGIFFTLKTLARMVGLLSRQWHLEYNDYVFLRGGWADHCRLAHRHQP